MKYELTGKVEKFERENDCLLYYIWEFVEDGDMDFEKALRIIGEGKRIKITLEEI